MYTTEGKKIISTDKAPKAIGPYSQAIRTENLVFTAGQVGLDPAAMEIVEGIEQSADQRGLRHHLDLILHRRDCEDDVDDRNDPEPVAVYQANAQTIKTQDQVMQTLVNLR